MKYIFDITPQPKPRMTQRDKWRNTRTKSAQRYMNYAEDLKKLCLFVKFKPVKIESFHITFFIPLKPMDGLLFLNTEDKKHQSKPDIDNLLKAFMDALFEDDAQIWFVQAKKLWTHNQQGRIEVEADI